MESDLRHVTVLMKAKSCMEDEKERRRSHNEAFPAAVAASSGTLQPAAPAQTEALAAASRRHCGARAGGRLCRSWAVSV
ncbi:hypothetical protein GN956_G9953 [Arapaima gigas]